MDALSGCLLAPEIELYYVRNNCVSVFLNPLQLEENVERDKRARQDLEKAKRKVEGELKVAQENIDEITKQKHDIEQTLKRLVSSYS